MISGYVVCSRRGERYGRADAQRRPDLDPQSVPRILMTTARDLGPAASTPSSGRPGDAYRAVWSANRGRPSRERPARRPLPCLSLRENE